MASSGGLTSFSFNSNTLSVAAGGTGSLALTLDSYELSAEVGRTITFASSDTSIATATPATATIQVATFSYSVTVTGVSAGSATITATCTDSQGVTWTSTATITVTNATQVIVAEQSLQDIADAIRGKLGVNAAYKPADMASAIGSISSGASPCRLTISSTLGVNLACAYTTTTGTYSSTTFSTSTSIDTIAGGIVYVYNSAGNWTVDSATGCTAYNMGTGPYTVALIVCTGATASIQFISSCFPAGTEILMASGETERIESVKAGCNIHSQEDCQVEKTYRHNYSGRIVTIYDTDGEILLTSTPNHLAMINNAFTPVGDSNVGDKVMTKNGEVEIGAVVSNEFVGEVFNISVSDPHTYYAGAGLVLCHNKPI